jgi:hypothetical protein
VHRGALLACAILPAAAAAELDSVVLTDGTVLRGEVLECGEQIRFSPRGTEPEILLDAKFVRTMFRANGDPCATLAAKIEAPAAAARPASRGVADVPEPGRRFYALQIFGLDLAAVGLGAAAIATASGRSSGGAPVALGIFAGGAYLLGGPIVHGMNGGGWPATRSFLLRAGLPLAGALIGGLIGHGSSSGSEETEFLGPLVGGAIGAGVGWCSAVLIDWSTAYVDTPAAPARLSLAPVGAPATRAPGLSLTLRF